MEHSDRDNQLSRMKKDEKYTEIGMIENSRLRNGV